MRHLHLCEGAEALPENIQGLLKTTTETYRQDLSAFFSAGCKTSIGSAFFVENNCLTA